MTGDILFPTDGSPAAREAAPLAYEQAEKWDATLHVLHVIDETEAASIVGQGQQTFDRLAARAEDVTEEITTEARERGLAVREATRQGKPEREILSYVEREGIDLLIMSTRGRSGVGRFLMGSTTEGVLRQSEVPVLAIPR